MAKKGLIEKPQFDISIFKIGKAVHITRTNKSRYELFSSDALIAEINPLKMIVVYYSEKELEITNMIINVEDVISGEFMINTLEEEE